MSLIYNIFVIFVANKQHNEFKESRTSPQISENF